MSNSPVISILVNCYNSEPYLKAALDSIYSQTYQNFQIILVDNCSVDKTSEIASQYDSRLHYVKTDKLIPLYAARNVGLKHIKGDFLAFLDSDDIWLPTKLEEQLNLMEEKKLDFIYSNYGNIVEHSSSIKKRFIHFYLSILKINLSFRSSRFIPIAKIISSYDINLQTVMIRRSAINHLNFNERLNLYGDFEFFLKLLYVNKILPYYFSNKTSLSRVHERQLSRKSHSNWIKEAKISFNILLPFMSKEEKEAFIKTNMLLNMSNLYIEKKQYKKALRIKGALALNSYPHFVHFIKSLLIITKQGLFN